MRISNQIKAEVELFEMMDGLITRDQYNEFYDLCKSIKNELISEGFEPEDIDKYLSKLPERIR